MADDTLDSFAEWLSTDATSVSIEEPAKLVMTGMLSRLQEGLTGAGGVPVVSGRLQSSITPYRGDPPLEGAANPPPGSVYSVQGEEQVKAVMEDWKLGEDLGIVSNVPYSQRILVEGYSSRFSDAQLELIIEEATTIEGGV